MAKKGKTNTRNKATALQEDPRVNMYEGKDRVLETEDEEIAKTEQPTLRVPVVKIDLPLPSAEVVATAT